MNSKSLLKNFLALTAGTANQLLIQIFTVPIFLLRVDPGTYATWLVAYNIALFTTMLDFGQITASQNSFHLLATRHQNDVIRNRTSQISSFIAISFVLYFFALVVFGIVLHLSYSIPLCGIFILLNFIQSYFGLVEATARAYGRTGLGIYISNLLRFSEFLGIIFGLIVFPNSLVMVAVCALTLKVLVLLMTSQLLGNKLQIIRFVIPRITTLKRTLREGLPFLTYKASEWLLVSGTAILLQSRTSPEIFILFITSRTFFRLGWQIASLISSTYALEMSAAWGRNDLHGTRQLARRSLIATASCGMFGNLVYFYQGNTIYNLWTHNQIQLGKYLLLLGTLYSFLISFSYAQKAIFHAINKNLRVSLISIGFAILVNVIIYVMNSPITIDAIYLILVSAEFISIPIIYLISRKLFISNFNIR